MEKELKKLRENIDFMDRGILELILKRMEYVEKVGELKGRNSFRIYVPERENSIFKNLYERGRELSGEEKISQEEIESIFTEIISFCRSKERKIRVAIEDYNCFFIGMKIFGSCIDMGYFQDEKKVDFRILKLQEKSYEEIFSEEIFKFVVSTIDFSGERYIILGRESNGKVENSWRGVMISYPEEGRYEWREYPGSVEEEEIKRGIEGENKREIKILGFYEKRKIEGERFKGGN